MINSKNARKSYVFLCLRIFLKNRHPGGAPRRWNFSAGAWLRHTPAIGCGILRRRTLSDSAYFAAARHDFLLDISPNNVIITFFFLKFCHFRLIGWPFCEMNTMVGCFVKMEVLGIYVLPTFFKRKTYFKVFNKKTRSNNQKSHKSRVFS